MNWREGSRPFNELTDEYDSWFDNNPLFDIELKALQAIRQELPRPWLEIGVGPGRFAEALGVDYGIDPAISPLQLATRRSIITVNAIGENIPFRPDSMGTVHLLFTWCFLMDPGGVLRECSQVLKPGGRLVIGFIPQLSAWGKLLRDKGETGHPCYRYARFMTIAETKVLLMQNGFSLLESWSTLLQHPGNKLVDEDPRSGDHEQAGFCILISGKEGEPL